MKKFIPSFQKVLKLYYPKHFQEITAEIAVTFDEKRPSVAFVQHSGNPMDKRMEVAAYFLATMQVLEKRGENFAQIRAVTLEIAKEFVRPKTAFHAFLKKLPGYLITLPIFTFFVRKLGQKMNKNTHSEGFKVEFLTDKNETYGLGYGVNIVECGICKMFDKHKMSQYAKILCEIDEITAALAGLELIRTSTIAQGAKICDFRWRKQTK